MSCLKRAAVDGVQADVDPVQPGGGQRGRDPGQADGVGGEADLGAGVQRRRAGDDADQAGPQQRLAAGEADLPDAELLHADADQPDDLLVGEHLDLGQPVQALGRHAVGAAQVAAVGQRHPQVGGHPAVPVDQPAGARATAPAAGCAGRTHGSGSGVAGHGPNVVPRCDESGRDGDRGRRARLVGATRETGGGRPALACGQESARDAVSPRTVFGPYARIFAPSPARAAFSFAGWLARLPMPILGLGAVLLVEGETGSYGLAGAVAGTLALVGSLASPQWARAMDRRGQGAGPADRLHRLPRLRASPSSPPSSCRRPAVELVRCSPALTGACGPNIGSIVRARWADALRRRLAGRPPSPSSPWSTRWSSSSGPPLVTLLATLINPPVGFLTGVVHRRSPARCGSPGCGTPSRRCSPPAPSGPGRAVGRCGSPSVLVVGVVYLAVGAVFGAMDVVVVAFAEAEGAPVLAGVALSVYAGGSLVAGLVYGVVRLPGSLAARFLGCAVFFGVAAQLLLTVGSLPVLIGARLRRRAGDRAGAGVGHVAGGVAGAACGAHRGAHLGGHRPHPRGHRRLRRWPARPSTRGERRPPSPSRRWPPRSPACWRWPARRCCGPSPRPTWCTSPHPGNPSPGPFPGSSRSGNPDPMSTRRTHGSAATGADHPGPAEPIVEFAGLTPYEEYVGVRQLQALVRPVTDHPAEPAFLVVTQIMELWFVLLRREWELAQRELRADDLDGALAAVRRSVHHLRSLDASWGSLLWLTPAEFNGFREQLGEASGFQSYEYRHVEFLLGLKAESVVRPHRALPSVHADLLRALGAPSLEDDVHAYLGRRGLPGARRGAGAGPVRPARRAPRDDGALGGDLPRPAARQRALRARRGADRCRRGVHDVAAAARDRGAPRDGRQTGYRRVRRAGLARAQRRPRGVPRPVGGPHGALRARLRRLGSKGSG